MFPAFLIHLALLKLITRGQVLCTCGLCTSCRLQCILGTVTGRSRETPCRKHRPAHRQGTGSWVCFPHPEVAVLPFGCHCILPNVMFIFLIFWYRIRGGFCPSAHNSNSAFLVHGCTFHVRSVWLWAPCGCEGGRCLFGGQVLNSSKHKAHKAHGWGGWLCRSNDADCSLPGKGTGVQAVPTYCKVLYAGTCLTLGLAPFHNFVVFLPLLCIEDVAHLKCQTFSPISNHFHPVLPHAFCYSIIIIV